MSLETVVEDIREKARGDAERILSESDAEGKEIIDKARKEASVNRAVGKEEISRKIELEKEQKFSSTNLAAKQKTLEKKRDLLELVRQEIENEISQIKGKEREELTGKLIESSVKEFIDVKDVVVYGNVEDEKLLKSLLKKHKGVKYGGEYECIGGVVMESESARMRVNNTFDSIIETVWTEELKNISELLFGSNQ
ncbi:MAG TPA: V-type ATP synthase subunit E [Halobacteriales archaeon]|uniref:V-type ATP synthase subunit E n=1 Tax=Candidatus Hikarchaeum yamanae TaxID=2675326 RepID=UPI0017F869BE|nr:V-type ATP synthase subunit E [Halobacteriales archaeon]|tara:strand:+ start:9505 stop:10092 length:588 start_codon:yes stop_codon:yes gene_type:complete